MYLDSRLPDEWEIRKLHFKYGYYLDKCLYQEVTNPGAIWKTLLIFQGERSLLRQSRNIRRIPRWTISNEGGRHKTLRRSIR